MTVSTEKIWDCRESILRDRQDRCSTCFSTTFLPVEQATGDRSSQEHMVSVAYNTGHIRIFRARDTMLDWATKKGSGTACLAWLAHMGPVYSLSCIGTGAQALLVSGGDDGWLRAWRLLDLLPGCFDGSGAMRAPSGPPSPVWERQVPKVDSVWGGTGQAPGVVCTSVDPLSSTLYVGATDGGVHVYDVTSSVSACGSSATANASGGALGRTPPPLRSMPGHAAGVLSLDVSLAIKSLASGSEDGSVRLWDCRSPGGAACTGVINPWDGVDLPLSSPAQQLHSIRGPHVSAVKFASEGGWLIVGTGNSALTLWSLSLGALAKQQTTPMVPQVIATAPGEILVGGSSSALLRYRFSALDVEPAKHNIGARSVFGLDIHPASGSIVVCGSGSCVDLLSSYGSRLGAVFPTGSED